MTRPANFSNAGGGERDEFLHGIGQERAFEELRTCGFGAMLRLM
jgi:hypothetical protein